MVGRCPRARYLLKNTLSMHTLEPLAAGSVQDTFLRIPYFYASCLLELRHLSLEVRGAAAWNKVKGTVVSQSRRLPTARSPKAAAGRQAQLHASAPIWRLQAA